MKKEKSLKYVSDLIQSVLSQRQGYEVIKKTKNCIFYVFENKIKFVIEVDFQQQENYSHYIVYIRFLNGSESVNINNLDEEDQIILKINELIDLFMKIMDKKETNQMIHDFLLKHDSV